MSNPDKYFVFIHPVADIPKREEHNAAQHDMRPQLTRPTEQRIRKWKKYPVDEISPPTCANR